MYNSHTFSEQGLRVKFDPRHEELAKFLREAPPDGVIVTDGLDDRLLCIDVAYLDQRELAGAES